MADTAVSGLTAATSAGGSDLVYAVVSSNSRKMTVTNFWASLAALAATFSAAIGFTNTVTLSGSGTIDGGGKQIANHILSVVTSVSGSLTTTAHSGNVIKTSGNITVPTTTGFHCTVIAGGAHTISFNSTTSAAMAAGDIVSLFVESATVIHAVKTLSANKVTFA